MKIFLVFVLFLFHFLSFAQKRGQEFIDSLEAALPRMKDDTMKVIAYNRIALSYENINPLRSFPFAQRGLALSEKLNYKKGIANFCNNLGLYISDTGNSILARSYLERSYALNVEMGSHLMQIRNLINIGRTYQFESNFTDATAALFRAKEIAEKMKDNELISYTAANLANCYFTQQDYTKAAEYANLTLKHATLAGDKRNISKAYQQLAGTFHMQKDTAKSIAYLQKAIAICEESGDQIGLADALLNLGLEYPDYKKQIAIMLRVDSIMEAINPNTEINIANKGNLGNAYLQLAKTTASPGKEGYLLKAEEYLLQSKQIAEQNATPQYQAQSYTMLSALEEEKGNFRAALNYYRKATITNDSLFSQEKKNAIAGFESKHKLAVKDDEIAINKLRLASQRKTQWGLIGGVAFLTIIGGLLYWQSRNRKKTNTTLMVLNNQLDEANKVKSRFFSILSHDLRSPVVNLIHFLHLQKNSPDLLSVSEQDVQTQQISKSAEDLLLTMEAMLLWSKEQMENFRPNIQRIPVATLFGYIQQFFATSPGVTISFEHSPGQMLSADENYLRTIMQNLTSNAIRALKDTANAKIVWSATTKNDKTVLSITDNGPGIGADEARSLFDDQVVSNQQNGLGFHLVRDLAKAINYRIAIDSESKKGTTFTLENLAA